MLKRHVTILLIWVLLSVLWIAPASAQDTLWSRAYGRSIQDRGNSVQQTEDGGYVVAGWMEWFGPGLYAVYLVKTNSLGDTLWARTYGGSVSNFGYSVQQTEDGGYIVAGSTNSFGAGNFDVYLIRTDSLGDTLWTRTYGGNSPDWGSCVRQTQDRGYIVTGYTDSFGAGTRDVYLIKTDSLGDTLWARTYGGTNLDGGNCVCPTQDGGYIVTGWTDSFGAGEYDVYLIKVDSLGDTMWSRTYGGDGEDQGYSVQQTEDGEYVVAGWTESFGLGSEDACLIKIDSLGDTIWTRTYGGSSRDKGNSVEQTSEGGYIVAGWSRSFCADGSDVYLVKTNSLGDALWSRTYGGDSYEWGHSVRQTKDGGYIVAGATISVGAGGEDLMLTKIDSLGNACIGEFVSSAVMSISPSVASPATVVTSPATLVTIPPTEVTSPGTKVTTLCVVIRGDPNGDGIINVGDVVYLARYLYRNGPNPDPPWVGDCNCDHIVDVGDIVHLVSYLYRSGPPPDC